MRKIVLSILFIYLSGVAGFSQTPGDEEKEMLNKGKERDQKYIDEAISGWWTASMKTQEQRIQWWKEAKFGMFIHWGIYSLPGGEWKGKKVSGYAEHLMRKEKISRKEYLDLAHQFNPVQFNAEEWIVQAKKAGMKYFIITAKHHDGFAMFDSKVSEFTITQQTPFKRDPMAELAAAAKKHGIRFGFYYSHAFDWEHPEAPGNDWEYKNPGGDSNLHGGRNWYDLHPELLVKAKKYVDEKAIPQIRELLVKYHPDILWFDTPHKLPLSENIRILKAIREVDDKVVVNGRLVRFADSNFGDYRNTADRPAEFFPVTGNWEAIPTTNESYGYHKFDSSHKAPSHFIQLLAMAASRGGNLLMNIGPMGNGSFDSRDITILEGIGNWMDKNGESIYGTTASPLPIQSWGVSTLKGNKVYLHVFNWPADGILHVSGLLSRPQKVYPLMNPSKPYVVSGAPAGYFFKVPASAPDHANSVVVLEFPGKIETHPVRAIAPNSTMDRLLAFDAKQNGKGFNYGDGKTNRYYVEGWKSKEQGLSWEFNNVKPGDYKVKIKYLAPAESAGGVYSISLFRNKIETIKRESFHQYPVETTVKNTEVITRDLDMLRLKSGVYILVVDPVSITGSELMKLLEIQLIPLAKNNVNDKK